MKIFNNSTLFTDINPICPHFPMKELMLLYHIFHPKWFNPLDNNKYLFNAFLEVTQRLHIFHVTRLFYITLKAMFPLYYMHSDQCSKSPPHRQKVSWKISLHFIFICKTNMLNISWESLPAIITHQHIKMVTLSLWIDLRRKEVPTPTFISEHGAI